MKKAEHNAKGDEPPFTSILRKDKNERTFGVINPFEPIVTAIHEAGHAVATVGCHGYPVKAVVLRDVSTPYIDHRGRVLSGILGVVEGDPFYSPGLFNMRPGMFDPYGLKVTIVNMKREIIRSIAGPWAEGEYLGIEKEQRRKICRVFEDYRCVRKTLKDYRALMGRDATWQLRALEDETYQWVKQNWSAIEAVGRALHDSDTGVLYGDEMYEICRKHSVKILMFSEQAGLSDTDDTLIRVP